MNLGIKDRLALVTGASKGIGRGIATALAQEGARMILVARSAEQLAVVRNELSQFRPEHYTYAIDLMAEDGVARLISSIKSELGNPDIIVHNLGGSFGISAFASAEDWKK